MTRKTFLFFLGLAALVSGWRTEAQQSMADGIVAIVGDAVVTTKDVERSIAPSVELLVRQYGNDQEELKRKVVALQRERIEELVARQLILLDFTNAGYNLPESFIEDRVREKIRQDYYGDRVKLMKTLQEEGITMEQFRKNIRENIIISALREKHVSQELIISPQKIAAYYQTNQAQFQMEDQVKLRMIELTKSKEAPETAAKVAAEIVAKLDAGASFAEMASVYSEGSKRSEGGDWGWVERKRSGLRQEIVDAAFALKAGQHSKVIETPAACYIMFVEEVKPTHVKSLSEVRAEIEKTLIAREQDRLQRKWVDRLRSKAFVRYF